MIAEFGVVFLISALFFSVFLALMPIWEKVLVKTARYYVYGQFFFIALAYLCLTLCFLKDDFSVRYVALNSSLSLPFFYKLCAVWGGHEGSMLLWVFILSLWTLAVAIFNKMLDSELLIKILSVLALLAIGFLLFLLLTSNPFTRDFSYVGSAGRDLNPLLQDPGFLFHPPTLYMGYVGLSVAFAFAIGALWQGRIEPAWARWTRPWTLAAWCFLTIGITLGSWWAYRELGWGGWWFWDPVENASFMPWLVATALIHSLMVCEKRAQFKTWTVLLAIIAFSLSLIGTFLVRSGVLTSVHAFAVDPARGLYILLFLLLVIGGALVLFAIRGQDLAATSKFNGLSKESGLLLNNIFLLTIMLTVLLGTLYPLISEALHLGKWSVGAPYFNAVFVPLTLPFLFIMGVGIHLAWYRDSFRKIMHLLGLPLLIALALPLTAVIFGHGLSVLAFLALSQAIWIVISSGLALFFRSKQIGISNINSGFYGMLAAHLGVACTVIGIVISSTFGSTLDVRMHPGESIRLSNMLITFQDEMPLKGPNYHGSRTAFSIKNGGKEHIIYPEKRIYDVAQMAMTDAAIDVNPVRDIYIALGEPLDDVSWSVRIYYKPLVRWIWGGGFLMLFGGIIAMLDRRYRMKKHVEAL